MAVCRQLRSPCLTLLALLLVALAAPPAQAAAPLQQNCFDMVINGGFETRDGWTLGSGPLPPSYVNTPARSGSWAMQVGNFNLLPSVEAFSSFYQTLTIPANAVSAGLSFWVWTFTEANPGNDRQEALLLVPGANVQSSSSTSAVWWELSNSGSYQLISRSLSSQIGRTFELTFSVYNDGLGGRTWMYVDDVVLTVCLAAPTATPTTMPSPSATASPTPAGPSPVPPNCVDILTNGDFEWDGAWHFGETALLPFYAGPPNPVLSGNRSMALGAVLPGAPSNVASFSSIQQSVTLPSTAQTARIRFHYYPSSTAAASGFNRQELVLLDPLNFEETIEVPWRVTENANQWLAKEIDLTRHLGRTLTIYFNARNAGDGTRTAMFLDQVQVLACDFVAIMPVYEAMDAYKEVQPYAENYALPSAPASAASPASPAPAPTQMALVTPAVISAPTVIAVGDSPTPLPETTPAALAVPVTEPTETPRREQRSLFDFDLSTSPWWIIGIISLIALAAVVLALIFFRGDKEETGGG